MSKKQNNIAGAPVTVEIDEDLFGCLGCLVQVGLLLAVLILIIKGLVYLWNHL